MIETVKLTAGIAIMAVITAIIVVRPTEIADLIVLAVIGIIVGGIGVIVDKLFSGSKPVEAHDKAKWINHSIVKVIIGSTTGLAFGIAIGSFMGDSGAAVGGGIGLIFGVTAAIWEVLKE